MKQEKIFYNRKIENMTRTCDDLAARHWKLEASDRDLGYELWLKEVKKISHFIDIFKRKDSNVD